MSEDFSPDKQYSAWLARAVQSEHHGWLTDTYLKSLRKQRILVTGGANQIGLNILRHLLPFNVNITSQYYSRKLSFSHPSLQWQQMDLRQENIPSSQEYDALIHTIPIWFLPKYIKHFDAMGIKRIVCFSSTSLFGKASSHDPKEQHMVKILKRAEENVAKESDRYGIHYTILRPTLIYGMGLDQNITRLYRFIQRWGCVPVAYPGTGKRQPVHADDLALGAIAALNNAKSYGQSYNLCGGETLPYKDMVKRIYQVMGKTPRVIAVPFLAQGLDIMSFFVRKPGISGAIAHRMNQDLTFDDSPAQHDLGYVARPFLAGGMDDLEPYSTVSAV